MFKRVVIAALIIIPFFAHAQKEVYQGLFLYQFSKYIKWPDAYNTNGFEIGVIGSEEAFSSIHGMVETKKQTQGMNMAVKKYTALSQIEKPHIIFIDSENSAKLNEVISKTRNLPVLIVTEGDGLASRGSIINFVQKEGKMRFELNLNQAESNGLKVSNSLTSLAIVI